MTQVSDLLDTAKRRAYVLELRRSGATYAAIAEATLRKFGADQLPNGWDERYAYKDVKRELDKIRSQIEDDATAVRTLELERLDRMLLGIWSNAAKGDYSAIDRALKLMKRRADLLGLDAPTRNMHNVTSIDLSTLTTEQLERIAAGEDIASVLATSGKS